MSSLLRIQLLFVLLWSSAFIALELCSAHVEPATFVVVRAVITAIILLSIALIMRMDWPRRGMEFVQCCVVGILLHGVYGGGAFASIYHGIDVGLCALILSLQPMLTLLLSSLFLAEKITIRKTFGILLGFIGVLMVILEGNAETAQLVLQNESDPGTDNSLIAISLCCMALLAISSATIVQKRFCSETKPIPGTCIQFSATAIVMLPIALMFETMEVNWSSNFILSLGWLVLFVSIGAMSLLMTLIRQGEAGSVANLFYLVTPLVAMEAWIVFGDKITVISVVGILLCMTGVVIVNYAPIARPGVLAESMPRVRFDPLMVVAFSASYIITILFHTISL